MQVAKLGVFTVGVTNEYDAQNKKPLVYLTDNGYDHRAGTNDLIINSHAQVRLRVHRFVIWLGEFNLSLLAYSLWNNSIVAKPNPIIAPKNIPTTLPTFGEIARVAITIIGIAAITPA